MSNPLYTIYIRTNTIKCIRRSHRCVRSTLYVHFRDKNSTYVLNTLSSFGTYVETDISLFIYIVLNIRSSFYIRQSVSLNSNSLPGRWQHAGRSHGHEHVTSNESRGGGEGTIAGGVVIGHSGAEAS